MARDNTAQSRRSGRATRRAFLAAAGGGISGLAGCSNRSSGDGENTVTYGILIPVTGRYGVLADTLRRGALLGVQTVNESDDFGFEIEPVIGDTGTDPAQGERAARRLVERDGATYLVGGIANSVALSISDLARDEAVVYVSGGDAVSITGSECNEYVFRAETNAAMVAEAVSAYTANNLGTEVWFHVADYRYGESVLNLIRSRMAAASPDFEVVGTSRSKRDAGDFDSAIGDISDSEAEVAVLAVTGRDLVDFVAQAADRGLTEAVNLVSPDLPVRTIREALGEAAVGTFGGVRYLPRLETGHNQRFVEAYVDEHGEPPDTFARAAYQSVLMTARGIEAAVAPHTANVKDVLPGLEVPSVLGPNRFRECDHQAENPVWMGELVESGGPLADVKLLQRVDGHDAVPPCEKTGCDL